MTPVGSTVDVLVSYIEYWMNNKTSHFYFQKEEKDEGEKKERRPFSRDVDLQVNRFDEAQKRSIIKKAQALDTRFSRGEAKYL